MSTYLYDNGERSLSDISVDSGLLRAGIDTARDTFSSRIRNKPVDRDYGVSPVNSLKDQYLEERLGSLRATRAAFGSQRYARNPTGSSNYNEDLPSSGEFDPPKQSPQLRHAQSTMTLEKRHRELFGFRRKVRSWWHGS